MLFTLSEPGVKKDIAKSITEAYIEGSIFEQFIGTGDNAPIKTQNETGNTNGLVDMRLRANIRTGGVKDNEDFETNRGKLGNLYQQLILEVHGNSVESGEDVKLLNQTQFINFREDAKDGLTEQETDKLDRIILSRATANCTCIVAAGHRTDITTANIAATDYATVADIRDVIATAKSSKHKNGSKKPKIKPYKTIITTDTHGVSIKRKIYLMFVGEATAFNIKQDPAWAEAQQAATDIGLGSPIFTGQLGVIDDCVLLDIGTVTEDYAGIYTSADTGFDGQSFAGYAGTGGAKTEINILMGATAMVMPMDSGFNYYEEDYDMKRKARIGIDRQMAVQKAKFVGKKAHEIASSFHNKDFGIVAFVASAAKNEA